MKVRDEEMEGVTILNQIDIMEFPRWWVWILIGSIMAIIVGIGVLKDACENWEYVVFGTIALIGTIGLVITTFGDWKQPTGEYKYEVIIDDTEYEIVARTDYLDYLKQEIKRVQDAQRYYDKMRAAITESKREYYKMEIKCYLKAHEDPEKIPQMLAEFEETYKVRKAHIARLYDEVKQIKRLTI